MFLRRTGAKLEKNAAIIIDGKANISERESKITASSILTVDEVIARDEDKNKELWVCFANMDSFMMHVKNLQQLAMNYPGFTPVYVQLKEEKKMKQLSVTVNVRTGIVDALKLEYGTDMVLVRDRKKS
jgi:hypothetical protein